MPLPCGVKAESANMMERFGLAGLATITVSLALSGLALVAAARFVDWRLEASCVVAISTVTVVLYPPLPHLT